MFSLKKSTLINGLFFFCEGKKKQEISQAYIVRKTCFYSNIIYNYRPLLLLLPSFFLFFSSILLNCLHTCFFNSL